MHLQVHEKCWRGAGGPAPRWGAHWDPAQRAGFIRRVGRTREIVETEGQTMERGVVHVPPGEGRILRVLGQLVTYKITSDQTGGAYSLFEVASQPGIGAPPHVQHRQDEAFYVLEGDYEFLVEGRTITAGAGSLIYVPKGNLHVYRNVGEGTGRMLVSQTPGGLHERFFEEVGEEAPDRRELQVPERPENLARTRGIAAGYGIEIPLPPEVQTQPKESK
jgi:mannose-6-phosphate isomerase-like protein (cupin superfamily)